MAKFEWVLSYFSINGNKKAYILAKEVVLVADLNSDSINMSTARSMMMDK